MPETPLPSLKPLFNRLYVLDPASLPDAERRVRPLVLDTLARTIAGLDSFRPSARQPQ